MQSGYIGYYTRDEVNLSIASSAARECGAMLCRLVHALPQSGSHVTAVLHDWDYLAATHGHGAGNNCLSQAGIYPVAVHGYNLDDHDVARLQARGVIVSRRLCPELIRDLCNCAGITPRSSNQISRTHSEVSAEDPSHLCRSVRSLATQAYRTIRATADGLTSSLEEELDQMLSEISRLQKHIVRSRRGGSARFDDLQRWLSSLRHQVKACRGKSSQ